MSPGQRGCGTGAGRCFESPIAVQVPCVCQHIAEWKIRIGRSTGIQRQAFTGIHDVIAGLSGWPVIDVSHDNLERRRDRKVVVRCRRRSTVAKLKCNRRRASGIQCRLESQFSRRQHRDGIECQVARCDLRRSQDPCEWRLSAQFIQSRGPGSIECRDDTECPQSCVFEYGNRDNERIQCEYRFVVHGIHRDHKRLHSTWQTRRIAKQNPDRGRTVNILSRLVGQHACHRIHGRCSARCEEVAGVPTARN